MRKNKFSDVHTMSNAELEAIVKADFPNDMDRFKGGTVQQVNKNDVKEFLYDLHLSSGKKKVSLDFLFTVYRFWSLEPVTKGVFGAELQKRLEKYRDKNQVYYLVKPRGLPRKKRFVVI